MTSPRTDRGASVPLGDRLPRLLAERSLSRGEVARRIGIDSSIVDLWVRGKRAVPEYRLPALAQALGLDVWGLLSDRSDVRQRLVREASADLNAYWREQVATTRLRRRTETAAPRRHVPSPVTWEREPVCWLCGRGLDAGCGCLRAGRSA